MNQEMPRAEAENPEAAKGNAIKEAIETDAELTTLSAAISTSITMGDMAMAKSLAEQLKVKLKAKTGLDLPRTTF